MTQLKPLDLWVVELPDGANNIKINSYNEMFYNRIGTYPAWKNLPDGDWQFHFTTQTAKERDWAGVVESKMNPMFLKLWFREYRFEKTWVATAAESGHSLLTANGLNAGKNWAVLTVKK